MLYMHTYIFTHIYVNICWLVLGPLVTSYSLLRREPQLRKWLQKVGL